MEELQAESLPIQVNICCGTGAGWVLAGIGVVIAAIAAVVAGMLYRRELSWNTRQRHARRQPGHSRHGRATGAPVARGQDLGCRVSAVRGRPRPDHARLLPPVIMNGSVPLTPARTGARRTTGSTSRAISTAMSLALP